MAQAPRTIVDMATRDLAREEPASFFGLAGLPVPTAPIRCADISVIMPELQADKVLVVDRPGPYALYPEFQIEPADEKTMRGWVIKQAVLTQHLEMPVSLVVYYLRRGGRATFPNNLLMGEPPLQSEFRYPTVLAWMKEDEIRQKYPELAPLLLVIAEHVTEAKLREVKGLIDGLEEPAEKRDNLYGLCAMLGMHYREEALVRAVFGPKFEEIKKMGFIDRWLEEKYQEGLNQGVSQGISQGISQGAVENARQVVLGLLADKFGRVPAGVAERVQGANADWCQRVTLQAAKASALEELDLS